MSATPTEAPLSPHPATTVRAAVEWARGRGLRVRLVPEVQGRGGWDPASAYRPFRQVVADMATRAREAGESAAQPGESRPEGAPG